MALEIKGLKRVFKLKKGNNTLKLDDPNPDMLPVEVMDFYSITYPELTTPHRMAPSSRKTARSMSSKRP